MMFLTDSTYAWVVANVIFTLIVATIILPIETTLCGPNFSRDITRYAKCARVGFWILFSLLLYGAGTFDSLLPGSDHHVTDPDEIESSIAYVRPVSRARTKMAPVFYYGDYWEHQCVGCLRQLENPGVGGENSIHVYSAESGSFSRVPCCCRCWKKMCSADRKRFLLLRWAFSDVSMAETGRWDLFPSNDWDMRFRAEMLRAIDKPGKRYDARPGEAAPGVLYDDTNRTDEWSIRLANKSSL